jgi:hypothetical protein
MLLNTYLRYLKANDTSIILNLLNINLTTEEDPNLSVNRVRTVPYRSVPDPIVPYPAVFHEGPFWSTAQRTVLL